MFRLSALPSNHASFFSKKEAAGFLASSSFHLEKGKNWKLPKLQRLC
jgi:hypothetical protein